LDMKLTVCHFPPGTSKWNKIEHRLERSEKMTLSCCTAAYNNSRPFS
jgi:hypothetical protein